MKQRHIRGINRTWGKQTGSIAGIVLTSAFFVALTVVVLQQSGVIFGQVQSEGASTELARLMTASGNYRIVNRSYAGISIPVLAANGYDIDPLLSGTADNTYGLDASVVGTAGDADATLTYAFADNPRCLNQLDRFATFELIKGAPACANGVLTLTLE